MKLLSWTFTLIALVLQTKSEADFYYFGSIANSLSAGPQTIQIFTNAPGLPEIILNPLMPPYSDPVVESCPYYSISNSANLTLPKLQLSLSSLSSEFHLVQCDSEKLIFIGSCFLEDLSGCLSQFLQLKVLSNYSSLNIYLSSQLTPRRLASCSQNKNGCSSCKSSSVCQTPQEGFYLTSSGTAERCQYGCKTCKDSTNCTTCFDGFINTNFACENCPGNCLQCSTNSSCDICDFGFFLDLGVCKPCMEGCYLCSNYTSCGKNYSGYELTDDGYTVKCPAGCYSCNGTVCLSCMDYYYLENGICFECSDNCIECSDFGSCSKCADYYYVGSYGFCERCFDNCLTCTSTECLTCQTFYYLAGTGLCKACLPNCDYCEISSYCSICSGGYKLVNGKCEICNEGCEDCSSKDCDKCAKIGYYMNSKGTCSACDEGCEYCDSKGCYYCMQGFYLKDFKCTRCNDEYLSCFKDGNVTGCEDEYYLHNGNGTCIKCPYGCLTCYHTACTKCSTGFFMYKSSCVLCSDGCFSCGDDGSCEYCMEGYYLSDGKCNACENGARYCNSTEDLTCDYGFYLDGDLCSPCDDGCKVCASSSECYICASGYILDSSICNECSNNCVDCQPGYYLDSLSCQACAENCLECTSSTICLSCNTGYYLNSDTCSPCQSNCQSCLNSTTCLSCSSGFILNTESECTACTQSSCLCTPTYYNKNSYTCTTCPRHCQTCSNSSTCQSCLSGYYLNSKLNCVSCPSNCSICTSSTCVQCDSGFYLDNKKCKPCYMYCSSCESLTLCTSCRNQFYLDSYGICQNCPENCKTCTSSECSECLQTYFKNSTGDCVKSLENCLIIENDECTYCINEYTVKFGECILCENIQVERTEFTIDFTSVEIEFNKEINITLKSNISCNECKEIARTDGNLGKECKCGAKGKIFSITLGKDYSLTSSSSILIITEMLFKYVCYNDQKSFDVYPNYKELPKQPIPFIRYHPIQSLNCDAEEVYFEVNDVYNSYGYGLLYEWVLVTSPTNQIVEGKALIEKSRKLTIDMSLFNQIATDLSVTVKVQNMVQLQGTTSVNSSLISDKFYLIELDIASPKTLLYNKNYIITSRIVDTCGYSYPRIKWKFDNDSININLYTTRLYHILSIPAFGLLPQSSSYTGKVITQDTHGVEGYLDFELVMKYSPLVIILNTQNCSIDPNQDFTLNASNSYNPNTNITEEKKKDLEFNWTYYVCRGNDCDEPTTNISDNPQLNFTSDELKSYGQSELRITLVLSSPGFTSATETAIIKIGDQYKVRVNLFADKSKYELINFGEKFVSSVTFDKTVTGVVLKWQKDGADLTGSKVVGMYTPQLYMYRKYIDAKLSNFKLSLSALVNNELVGYAYMDISKNLAPICAQGLSVTPLVDGKKKIYTDLFVFFITDCSDPDGDYPLTYRFSLRTCESNCDVGSINNNTAVFSAFYQLSIQKTFLELHCAVFFINFTASVQFCDSLRTCDASSFVNITAETNDPPSNFLKSYINDTKNKEHVPYYAIMYIKTFYKSLTPEEYNYIYNDYSLYMKKQKIVNFDVIHIALSFINELFKLDDKNINKPRYIRLYLNEVLKLIKKNSDIITQQNSDVTCEIVNNAMKLIDGDNDDTGKELLGLTLDFAEEIFKYFSVDRVIGDLIVNSSSANTNAKIIKYRDTAKNLTEIPNKTLKDHLTFFNSSVSGDKITSVSIYELMLGKHQMNMARLTSAGSYNDITKKYINQNESYIPVEKDSMELETKNNETGKKCFTLDGLSWEKEKQCSISSNSISRILISSSNLNRVEDSDYFVVNIPNTYAPMILSIILSVFALSTVGIIAQYEKKQESNTNKKHRKKQKINTTGAVIMKNTLFLSLFSRIPSINNKQKILHFFNILNLQLLIEGCFYGKSVLSGKDITVIVGTGFLVPIFTVPFNVLATYNIPKDKKWMNVTFYILWIFQLVLFTIFVIFVNLYWTVGKNAFWIYSFGVGITCELILEIIVMIWKNIREKHGFMDTEITA